jgi:hypothetical protein
VSKGIRPHKKDDSTIEDRKITHDSQHSLLLRTYNVRGTDKFRGTAKLGVNAGSCNFRRRFTAPHECPCIGIHPWASFDGQGFACEHRLIEQDRSSDQVHIGRNHSSQ